MASLKFLIVLGVVLIGLSSSQQGNSTATMNTCSNLSGMPSSANDCNPFSNNSTLCCYVTATVQGKSASACQAFQATLWATSKDMIIQTAKSFGADAKVECGYSFLTISSLLFGLFALLF